MTRIIPHQGRRFGGLGRWLAIAVLPAALAVGCSDNDNNPPPTPPRTSTSAPATRTPTAPPTATPTVNNTAARAACEKLVSCGQCFLSQRGVCISTEDCAGRLTAEVAGCISAVTGCDQQAVGTCLPFGCQGTGTGLCDMTAG